MGTQPQEPSGGNSGESQEDPEALLRESQALRREVRTFRITRQVLVAAMAVLIAALIAAGVLFSVYLANTRAEANSTRQVLREIHDNQVSACQIGNDLRSRERALWAHLLLESEKQGHVSKAGRAFVAYAEHTFPALDCAKLFAQPRQ